MLLLSAGILAYFATAAAASSFGGPTRFEVLDYNPSPSTSAVVVCNGTQARFTVLTAALIRMQYFNSSVNVTSDPATLAFVNRKLDVPEFTSSQDGSGCTITTSELTLTYTGGPFGAETLKAVSNNASSAFQSWNGGMTSATDPGSLLGTIRTLDGTANVTLNCTENGKEHCTWGVLSRSGWAVVDDSDNAILDSDYDWEFNGAGSLYPRQDAMDWYLFAHGHDYRRALMDFGLVSGRPALPPRAALGIWFTRWFDYANVDVRDIVEAYSSRDIPLDVLVLDMNWHSKQSWTGYSADTDLFPDFADLGSYARDKCQLLTLVNLHDAVGVGSWENEYDNMCKALGIACTGNTINANFTGREAMYALEDVVWKPVQDAFSDHAWIDWQQGENGGGMPGGKANPTIQLNRLRNTDPKRRGGGGTGPFVRGMQLGRFGDLGSQRYPVGFSGDVAGLVWSNLAYQPYFTMTSSNVAFGSWSHDIVGNQADHEMYTRWITWGSLSPVMRSHERGMSAGGCSNPFPDFDDQDNRCPTVMPWNTQLFYFEAIRSTLQRRATLIPYLYTASREAFDTAISLMRPLYYDWPESPEAYLVDSLGTYTNYMLGPDLLVSPITAKGANTTIASKATWLPPGGDWVELETHKVVKGGGVFTRGYAISQTPIFARAGAVVPYRPLHSGDMQATARRDYSELGFRIYPGAEAGSGRCYEDDGNSTAYTSGDFGWITTSFTWASDLTSFTANIAVSGTYSKQPATRLFTISVVNAPPAFQGVAWSIGTAPQPVLGFSRWGGAGSWSWDGQETSLIIELPQVTKQDLAQGVTVTVGYAASAVATDIGYLNGGLKGMQSNAKLAKAALDRTRVTPGAHTPDPAYLSRVVSSGDAMAAWAGKDPAAWAAMVANVTNLTIAALAEITGDMPPPPPPANSLLQMYDSDRKDSVLCGTAECIASNAYYEQVRIEGFQPNASDAGAIKLQDYWNQDINDNFASTAPAPPPGYVNAQFPDGYVYNSQVQGSVPLYCYFSSANNDHMAVATEAGIKQAQSEKYVLCSEFPSGIMGYVLTSNPSGQDLKMPLGIIGDELRGDFCEQLLRSSLAG